MSAPWTPSGVELERRAYRRSRSRRSALIALVSTVVVVGVLVLVVVNSSGWPRVRSTFFDLGYGWQVLPDILDGLWLNIRLMLACGACILVVGMIVALARTLRGPVFFPVRVLATAYADVFRGLPLILVLLLLGFGVPSLRLAFLPRDPLFWGCVSLVLVYGAYVSEVFRAGIESIHPSQRAASRSLGLSHAQTMRFVVVPQAVRRVLPPLLNDMVALQKDTGLLYVLGAVAYDAILNAKIETAKTFNYTPYVVAGLLFILLTIPMTRLTDYVARRQGWSDGNDGPRKRAKRGPEGRGAEAKSTEGDDGPRKRAKRGPEGRGAEAKGTGGDDGPRKRAKRGPEGRGVVAPNAGGSVG